MKCYWILIPTSVWYGEIYLFFVSNLFLLFCVWTYPDWYCIFLWQLALSPTSFLNVIYQCGSLCPHLLWNLHVKAYPIDVAKLSKFRQDQWRLEKLHGNYIWGSYMLHGLFILKYPHYVLYWSLIQVDVELLSLRITVLNKIHINFCLIIACCICKFFLCWFHVRIVICQDWKCLKRF